MSAWPIAKPRKRELRSPVKRAPLRQPGQSLRDAREDLTIAGLQDGTIVVYLAIIAATEWWRFFFPLPPNPWFVTGMSALGCAYFLPRLIRKFRALRNVALVLDGERSVGEYLDGLRENGYKILHDLPGEIGNVDHVLVGPAGVFAIETKTLRKSDGRPTVAYDGNEIRINGQPAFGDALTQAKAAAIYVRKEIQRRTGRPVFVQPVILYTGWYVLPGPRHAKVWVHNPDYFLDRLKGESPTLTPSQIHRIAEVLGDYVRAR